MSEQKYSYLPNSYTIKFFKLSKEQQNSFKPLLIINNIKTKKNQYDSNSKNKNKKQNKHKFKSKLLEKSLYNKKDYILMQKRKKAIDIYLNNKKNSSIKQNEEKDKYTYKNSENHSLSSKSKIPINPRRINHSFQELKLKKKTNIISQIKNNENELNHSKKKLHYCKTDKESNSKNKKESNNSNKNMNKIDKNEEDIKNTINSVVFKNNLENKINIKEQRYKTTDKSKNKSNKLFKKDISMKDNCFDIDNIHKENNIKVIKSSLINENKIENNKEKENNQNKENKENKEIENENKEKEKENQENKEILFKPNFDIFKNTKYSKDFKFLTDKNWKINKVINLNNNNYIIEKINHNTDIVNNKRNNSEIKNNEIKIALKDNNQNIKDNNDCKHYNTNNRPLNCPEIYKNSEISQFTFKKEEININNNSTSLLAEKRRNELKKLINFTNKF